MVHTVGSLCNGLICTDSARSMKEDTFGMRRPSVNIYSDDRVETHGF